MLHYVLAVVIAVATAVMVAGYFALRVREQQRIPSLNSLREASRRGLQRHQVRTRVEQTTTAAANAMLSDLRTGKP